jgi:hypothetical protein
VGGLAIELVSPRAAVVTLVPGGDHPVKDGTTLLTPYWFSSSAAEVDATLAPRATDWRGTWHLEFTAPAGTALSGPVEYTLRVSADLFPALVSPPRIVLGKAAHLVFDLVGSNGAPVSASPLLKSAALSATVVNPLDNAQTVLRVRRSALGRFAAVYRPPASLKATQLDLVLSADIRPNAGIDLTTADRVVPIEVLLPAAYPQIETSQLVLPLVTGRATTSGKVLVRAPATNAGCVWVMAGPVTLPDAANSTAQVTVSPPATSRGRCLYLQAGQTADLEVHVTAQVQSEGRANGVLTFFLSGAGVAGARTVVVPLQFQTRFAPNSVFAWALFVVLFVIGLALPLGFLHLLNWWTGKLPPPFLLRTCRLPVTVSPGGVANEDGSPPKVSLTDFPLVGLGDSGSRTLSLDGGVTFRARASGALHERLSLLAGPYAVAETPDGRPLFAGNGDRKLATYDAVGRQEVPLGLAGTWLFVPLAESVRDGDGNDQAGARTDGATEGATADGPGTDRVAGHLTLVIANGGSYRAGEDLLKEAEKQLPGICGQLGSAPGPRPSGRHRHGPPAAAAEQPPSQMPPTSDLPPRSELPPLP